MKAILFALFVGLLMGGYAASSSKDGEKVDSNHTSSGRGLNDLDLSEIDLGEDSDGEDPLERIEDEIRAIQDPIFARQLDHNRSLEAFRGQRSFFRKGGDFFVSLEKTINRYRKKAADPNASPRQKARYEKLAERFELEMEALKLSEFHFLSECWDKLPAFGDEVVEAFVWFAIVQVLEGNDRSLLKEADCLILSPSQRHAVWRWFHVAFPGQGEQNVFWAGPQSLLEKHVFSLHGSWKRPSPEQIEKLKRFYHEAIEELAIREPPSEEKIKAIRDTVKLIKKRVEANRKKNDYPSSDSPPNP
jgi:hypothetical protein